MRMRVWVSGLLSIVALGLVGAGAVAFAADSPLAQPVTIAAGWQLQDAAKVPQAGT